jgi:hypothetical protein
MPTNDPDAWNPNLQEAPHSTYDVTRLFNEDTSVEREIIENLRAPALVWTYISRETLAPPGQSHQPGLIFGESDVLRLLGGLGSSNNSFAR